MKLKVSFTRKDNGVKEQRVFDKGPRDYLVYDDKYALQLITMTMYESHGNVICDTPVPLLSLTIDVVF